MSVTQNLTSSSPSAISLPDSVKQSYTTTDKGKSKTFPLILQSSKQKQNFGLGRKGGGDK